MLWTVEEIISVRRKEVTLRAEAPPPMEYNSGENLWSFVMGQDVVNIHEVQPKQRQRGKSHDQEIAFGKPAATTTSIWDKFLTPIAKAVAEPGHGPFDEQDEDLDGALDEEDDAMQGESATSRLLRTQAAPGSAAHERLARVAAQAAEEAVRNTMNRNQQLEQSLQEKLRQFELDFESRQDNRLKLWGQRQDEKLQELRVEVQAAHTELRENTKYEFQQVQEQAKGRRDDLMQQMTVMMEMLQGHGEKRPSPSSPMGTAAKAKAAPGQNTGA